MVVDWDHTLGPLDRLRAGLRRRSSDTLGGGSLAGKLRPQHCKKKHHTLVKTGPYRYVRHPLYSAALVEAVGVSLLMANWFVAVMVAVFWIVLIYRTRLEENNLINRFGDEYKDYMAKSGRFLPSFRR